MMVFDDLLRDLFQSKNSIRLFMLSQKYLAKFALAFIFDDFEVSD